MGMRMRGGEESMRRRGGEDRKGEERRGEKGRRAMERRGEERRGGTDGKWFNVQHGKELLNM